MTFLGDLSKMRIEQLWAESEALEKAHSIVETTGLRLLDGNGITGKERRIAMETIQTIVEKLNAEIKDRD